MRVKYELKIFETIHKLHLCHDELEYQKILENFINSEYGLEYFTVSVLLPEASTHVKINHHCLLGNYPETWVKQYISNNYIECDPIIKTGLKSKGGTIYPWQNASSEYPYKTEIEKKLAYKMFGEASEVGLRHGGFAMIFDCPLGKKRKIGAAMASSQKDVLDITKPSAYEQTAIIYKLTLEFIERFLKLKHPGLTDRQHELLPYFADFLEYPSLNDIAKHFGISVTAVKKHQQAIGETLGVSGRGQIVQTVKVQKMII